MMVVWLVALGLPIATYFLGYRVGAKARVLIAMQTPPVAEEAQQYLVVARTNSGTRARKMFELGSAGAGESLELWDGSTCRGRKGSTEA